MSQERISQLRPGASRQYCGPGLGVKCTRTCARARLASAASSPALPSHRLCPRQGSQQQPLSPCPIAKGSSGAGWCILPPQPHHCWAPEAPQAFWPWCRRPGHNADPLAIGDEATVPKLVAQRAAWPPSPAVPQQHPHPGCRHPARKVTEDPCKAAGVTSWRCC